MLSLSFGVLLIVGLLGSALAAMHLRVGGAPPRGLFGALHGLLGAIGFAMLLLALRGPTRGAAMGVAAFGRIAAALLAIALIAGVGILILRLRHQPMTGLMIGIHATIAVGGIVILAAYTLIG
jgi:hypothetical protein